MDIIITQSKDFPTSSDETWKVFGSSDDMAKFRVKEIKAETDKAWLIHMHNNSHSFTDWFPKSNCVLTKSLLYFFVPQWLYGKKIIEGNWRPVVFI